jgi:hypothetical protein
MYTTVAYYQTATSNAVLSPIPAVADGTVRVVANDIYVPTALPNLLAYYALINSAAATLRAQVNSPSLRATLLEDIDPIANGLVFASPLVSYYPFDTVLPLVANEPLEVWIQNGAAVVNQALISFSDGPIKPITGKIFTVRCTAAASLSAGLWVNSALTFGQTLPAGGYDCVGVRVISTNGVGARLFFVGSPWRPGVPVDTTDAFVGNSDYRWGNAGTLGHFDNITPPTIDIFGITDTTQVVFLDLIKTS